MAPATPACALLPDRESIERDHARGRMETKPASHPPDLISQHGLEPLMGGRGHLRAVVVAVMGATQNTIRVTSVTPMLRIWLSDTID